jgi:prepilin signal peptidase PulO-like enzyme (type II secretory pathway)
VLLLLTLSLLSAADIRYRTIPKRVNLLAIGIIVIKGDLVVALWAIILFLTYCAIFLLFKNSIGFGDVRLAPIAANASDLITPLAIHGLAWTLAGLFVISKRGVEKSLPFAPFFALSMLSVPHL